MWVIIPDLSPVNPFFPPGSRLSIPKIPFSLSRLRMRETPSPSCLRTESSEQRKERVLINFDRRTSNAKTSLMAK